MPNQSGKIVLVLVLTLLTIGIAAYFLSPSLKNNNQEDIIQNSSIPTQSIVINESSKSSILDQDYYSDNLKISFKIPQEAVIEEKFTDVIVKLPKGNIQIRRIGTNFSNINDYINNLEIKNRLSLAKKEFLKVNNHDAVLIIMEDLNDKQKMLREYSIYDTNFVFKLFTSDEALYPVLDQVVQSFEYKP